MSRQEAFWKILLLGLPTCGAIGFLGGMLMTAHAVFGG